ncbi:MAG: DUF3783 domain-containing protein [Eubacteriales bacterium]|nr:DUF3783 domain-containing protein [Eubacteriales bacterium]
MSGSALMIYYIRDFRKGKRIAGLCKRLGIRLRELKPADESSRIGVLAGVPQPGGGRMQGEEREALPEELELPELLIFSGFPDGLLDTFLKEYRAAGIEPVGLKAVVTLHNMDWTVRELAMELMKERMAMQAGTPLSRRGEGNE